MILSLVSQKGGSGKSTLAFSIGCELVARGLKVLLVDADPQKTSDKAGEVAASNEQRVVPVVVSMGRELWRPEQLPKLVPSFDHVIIDTPGRSGDIQKAALVVADLALVPVGQGTADVWAVAATLEVIREARDLREMHGGQRLLSAVVLARLTLRSVLARSLRSILERSDVQTLKAVTTARVAWAECLSAGKGVAQYAPKDAAAVELRSVVDEVLLLVQPQEVANEVRPVADVLRPAEQAAVVR